MVGDLPEVGLVVNHMYLWRDEQMQGHEDGRKARPCLIVHKRQNEYDETEVFICPITHTPPKDQTLGREIPLVTKQRLKLDDDQSWIITGEVNRFTWRGPDLRKTKAGKEVYGYLPTGLTNAVIHQILENSRNRRLIVIDRDDEALNKKMRELRQRGQKPKSN